MALRRILASPKFLLRVEPDPAGVTPGAAYRLSDLALASRLSFFLWSSIPDDDLLDAAAKGELKKPAVLDRQVRRMLADPKAHALVEQFRRPVAAPPQPAQQAVPNSFQFPDFDDDLRRAMIGEVELFFESVIDEDRNVLDLMTADYTFVNERLARHYGMPDIYGSQFRRVTLTDDARRGLLGKGAILMATSHAHRTSPVLRGKWVLENIIGVSPAPPPDDVPALNDEEQPDKPRSGRERSSSIARARRVRRATACSIRSGSRSRTSTRSARGATRTAGRSATRSTRRVSWSTARRSTASWRCGRRSCATRRRSCGR